MITYKQLSLADIFTDCQNKFDNDKYAFLSILDETIDLDEIVPVSFVSHFHACHRQTPQASSFPDAQGSVITADLLNSNHFPPDRISEILPGTAGFLWLFCCSGCF